MSLSPHTPIIVGVGEICNRSTAVENAIEPMELMLQAIQNAFAYSSAPDRDALVAAVDSISVVPPWSWPYENLPGLLAAKLGAEPSHLHLGPHGGNQPGELCDEAARRIASGQSRISIIVGGEALASRMYSRMKHFEVVLIDCET